MLTYQQAAEKCGCGERVLRDAAAAKLLTVVRYGHRTVRIREADLEKFLERKTRKAR
jgi:excisionase family DNA binding protein